MSEAIKERVIRISDELDEFITDVDGFVYWWPDGSEHGHLSACHLRILADELDRRNAEWQAKINDLFS